MTRINTNVSSLNAQKTLARSNASLQESLVRLSTGLRINAGKDDPAGLIASEMLRSDIIGVERAITNSERASQVISTADSALGQVSGLLNDIRGLVTEAANTGAMSDDQIAANQLQIDSSLEAINRIAQTTSFQGRKLLDGSLDLLTTAGNNFSDIVDMDITQANLGANPSMNVDIRVNSAATKGEITMSGSPDAAATTTLTFGKTLTYQANDGAGTAFLNLHSEDGTEYSVVFDAQDTNPADATTASVTGTVITVVADTNGTTTDMSDAVAAINGVAELAGKVTASLSGVDSAITTADNANTANTWAQNTLQIDATETGTAWNNMAVSVTTHTGGANATATWTDLTDRSTLEISLKEDTVVTLADIETAVESATNASGKFAATVGAVAGASVSVFSDASGTTAATGDTAGTGGGVLKDDLVLQLTGKTGSEFLNFQANTTMEQIASAVNAISDTLGVSASVATTTGGGYTKGDLILTSSEYGSDALVDIDVVSEGSSGTFEANLSATRDTGTDIDATVNGSKALGSGNTLSLNTAMLDLEATITAGVEKTISFQVTGGGALFQLGPNVESTQQAQLGIGAVNTAQLRGQTGRLYELGSGQDASLTQDASRAATIVEEVINKVTSLRGRLGAFQKTTLGTNIASLSDTLENLTAAESAIRDADFAAESAKLTRNQILVQSGTSVLAMANQNPQAVLSLLR